MQSVVDELVREYQQSKNKKRLFWVLCANKLSPVMISEDTIEQLTSFKLLGITATNSLRWGDHVAAVTAKASKRLWFFKKLKRAGLPLRPSLLLRSSYQTCH